MDPTHEAPAHAPRPMPTEARADGVVDGLASRSGWGPVGESAHPPAEPPPAAPWLPGQFEDERAPLDGAGLVAGAVGMFGGEYAGELAGSGGGVVAGGAKGEQEEGAKVGGGGGHAAAADDDGAADDAGSAEGSGDDGGAEGELPGTGGGGVEGEVDPDDGDPDALDVLSDESPAAADAGILVQAKSSGLTKDASEVQAIAARGVQGGGGALPFADEIQKSFGPGHDLSSTESFIGGAAAEAAEAMGADAYATGNSMAFSGSPSLFTAAHEAAHVVQQRGGVQLLGGVGQAGDAYEQNADDVAGAVVRGESVEHMLGAGEGGNAQAIQGAAVQHKKKKGKRKLLDEENAYMRVRTYDRSGQEIVKGRFNGDAFFYGAMPAVYRGVVTGSKKSKNRSVNWVDHKAFAEKVRVNSTATGKSGDLLKDWAPEGTHEIVVSAVSLTPEQPLSGAPILDPVGDTISVVSGRSKPKEPPAGPDLGPTVKPANQTSNPGPGLGAAPDPTAASETTATASGSNASTNPATRLGSEKTGYNVGFDDGNGGQGRKGKGKGSTTKESRSSADACKERPAGQVGTVYVCRETNVNKTGVAEGSKKPSWVQNEKSGVAKHGGRVPKDDGKDGGSASGKKGGDGNFVESYWWNHFDLPEMGGQTIALGAVVSDANIAGINKKFFKEALENGSAALRKEMVREARDAAKKSIGKVKAALQSKKGYRSLSKREQGQILKRAELAIERRFYKRIQADAAKHAAENAALAAKLKPQIAQDVVARHNWDTANANMKAWRKVEAAAGGKAQTAERRFDKAMGAAKATGNTKGKGGLKSLRKNRSRMTFENMEVRAVKDLSHMGVDELRLMASKGTAGVDINGIQIQLHHHKQNHKGPIIEIPKDKHSIHNRKQHPRGNTAGGGLTDEQRKEFNAWRKRYWMARARAALREKGIKL